MVRHSLRFRLGDRDELEVLRRAVAASGDVIYDWDLKSDSIAWSDNARDVFRLGSLDSIATGEGFRRRVEGCESAPWDSNRRDSGARFETEYRIRRGDGELCWVRDSSTLIRGTEGESGRLVGMLREITGRRLHEARLEHDASHGDLTGHFNRPRLRDTLDKAIAADSTGGGSSLFFALGIDNLSEIAGTLGYAAADAVIIEVGRRLAGLLEEGDVIGRLAGHRYGLLLMGSGEHDMALRSLAVREAVRGELIDTGAGRVPVTVSLGSIVVPRSARQGYEAMSRAEEALDRAERGGGDRLVAFLPNDASEARRRRTRDLVQHIVETIEENRLLLAFQPIVAAGTRRISRYECLVRLIGDDGEMIPACNFMPVAEQLGLVRMIDRRVLDLVVAELEAWPELCLALNVSGFTLADPAWYHALSAHFARRPDLAPRLTVEITETVALREPEILTRFVTSLRQFGCHVALDDFGAGHSTFRRLKGLAVDIIKIDGDFVRGLAERHDNQVFVKTLLDLAKGLGLATIAECVENPADAGYLVKHGVDYLQGYWLGAPAIERAWAGRAALRVVGPAAEAAAEAPPAARVAQGMAG